MQLNLPVNKPITIVLYACNRCFNYFEKYGTDGSMNITNLVVVRIECLQCIKPLSTKEMDPTLAAKLLG